MKPLAWVLVIAVPWTAFFTVFLALRRGRPRPYAAWATDRIQRRLRELDAGGTPTGDVQPRDVQRERQQLWAELFARGRGHEPEGEPHSERPDG
ncbi:MAG: hypothetical protein ACJ71T_08685 [Actinomycetales bacterium]